jgi:hypothetical protein
MVVAESSDNLSGEAVQKEKETVHFFPGRTKSIKGVVLEQIFYILRRIPGQAGCQVMDPFKSKPVSRFSIFPQSG